QDGAVGQDRLPRAWADARFQTLFHVHPGVSAAADLDDLFLGSHPGVPLLPAAALALGTHRAAELHARLGLDWPLTGESSWPIPTTTTTCTIITITDTTIITITSMATTITRTIITITCMTMPMRTGRITPTTTGTITAGRPGGTRC